MTKWLILVVAMFTMLWAVGCGSDEAPAGSAQDPNESNPAMALKDDQAVGGNPSGVPDLHMRQFMEEADKRLEEHVIQIAGLKFLGDAYFDPALVVKLEEKLQEGQKILRQMQMADAINTQVIKGQLSTLLDQMDKIYEMAMTETAHRQTDIDDPALTEDETDPFDGEDDLETIDAEDEEFDDPDDLELYDDVDDDEDLDQFDDESDLNDEAIDDLY